MVLERAARPSGFAKPSTLTRQSLVLGFFMRLCFCIRYPLDYPSFFFRLFKLLGS
jgi:hypothetical protein